MAENVVRPVDATSTGPLPPFFWEVRVLDPSQDEWDTVTVGKAPSDAWMGVLAEALHAGQS